MAEERSKPSENGASNGSARASRKSTSSSATSRKRTRTAARKSSDRANGTRRTTTRASADSDGTRRTRTRASADPDGTRRTRTRASADSDGTRRTRTRASTESDGTRRTRASADSDGTRRTATRTRASADSDGTSRTATRSRARTDSDGDARQTKSRTRTRSSKRRRSAAAAENGAPTSDSTASTQTQIPDEVLTEPETLTEDAPSDGASERGDSSSNGEATAEAMPDGASAGAATATQPQPNPLGVFTFSFDLRASYIYLIFAGLAGVALGLRLWGLGEMAVHHDESLHGYHSWLLSVGEPHRHTPLMHGMFLFEVIAGSFFLFGDNEFTMRLPMALFGTGLVLVPLLLRRQLGTAGAIATAILLSISPAIFYYGRFARNDIFMAVFALLAVVAIFRYMDTRHTAWLYLLAGVMALASATKETAYILTMIYGAFLLVLCWREVLEFLLGRRRLSEFSAPGDLLIVLGALMLPFFAASVSLVQSYVGITIAARDGTPGVASGAPDGVLATFIALSITLVFAAVAWGIGFLWNWRKFLGPLLLFWGAYILVMTDFGTSTSGIATGVWQSLGYWIAQQEVRRGSQPWYYYVLQMSIYEFLPVLTGFFVIGYYNVKAGIRSIAMTAIGILSLLIALALYYAAPGVNSAGTPESSAWAVAPFVVIGVGFLIVMPFTLPTSRLMQFLIFWPILTFALYTFAGEKMPWLVVNVTLPWVALAGAAIGKVIDVLDWRIVWKHRGWLFMALTPVYMIVAWRLLNFSLGDNFAFSNWADVGKFVELWILFGIVIAGPIMAWRFGRRRGFNHGLAIIALGALSVFFAFTVKSTFVAVYVHADIAHEMLVYTQTTPDLHDTALEISRARELVWADRLKYERERLANIATNLPPFRVRVDSTEPGDWPWRWYLRGYGEHASYGNYGDYVRFGRLDGEAPSVDRDYSVVLVSDNNINTVRPIIEDVYTTNRYLLHRWWFPEGTYRQLTPGKIWDALKDRSRWRTALDYWFYREMPQPIGYSDAWVFFHDDIPDGSLR